MKRQIKFEYGFESQNGVVKKIYELSQIPNIANICDVWNELPICYVRQFTGLQDIKCKDVYEGDILCVPHLENTRHQVRMVIEWDNDNAEFTKYRPKNAFEIIGNIYENPELLKTTEHE